MTNKPGSIMKVADSAEQHSLRDLLTPVFRQRQTAILVAVGVFAFSLFFAWFWASRYYVSQMQIVVDQDRSDPAITAAPNAAVMSNRGVTTDQINSEVALIKGQDILRTTAEACGLGNRWTAAEIFLPKDPERIKAARIENAAFRLGKGVKVEAEKASDVINVKFGALGDPKMPACVLQTIGKLYLEKRLELHRPPGTFNFFAEQTEKYHQELADVETRLANFSREKGVAAPEVLRMDVAQQVAGSMASLNQAQQQIAGDEERLKTDATQIAKTPARISTQQSSNAANVLLQQLQSDLLTAQLKRDQLLVKYDPSYPLVQEANNEIAKTQAALENARQMNYANQTTDLNPTYQLLEQDEARTRLDLQTQKASVAAITGSISSMKGQMVDFDTMSVQQMALLREQKADEASYLLYLSKREQERTSNALDQKRIADVMIAVPAVPAALPALNPFLVAFGGTILALLAGIGSAFLKDRMDPSFRTSSEVMRILNLPVLAAIPRQITGKGANPLLRHENSAILRGSGLPPSLFELGARGSGTSSYTVARDTTPGHGGNSTPDSPPDI